MPLYIFVFLLLFIIILPALVIIPEAFTQLNYFTFPSHGFSMKWFEKFLSNDQWVIGLERSILIAIVAAICATVIGTLGAVAVKKLEFKGKSIFVSLMIAPMVIPVVVIGVALYSSLAPIGLTNTFTGLVIAHTLLGIPMVFVTMLSGLSGVNENLELAPMSMGTSPIGAFFKVTLPTVRASLVSSALFAFVTSLDEVVVTIFVSGADTKTLTMVMWENMRTTIDPTLAVAAVFMIILTLGMYILKTVVEIRTEKARRSAA